LTQPCPGCGRALKILSNALRTRLPLS
jgi:hypothetical protein